MLILWLAFEQPTHPDAVRAAAREPDVRFVLALLSLPYAERTRYAVQFANWLRARNTASPFSEDCVICRSPDGVRHFVNWRIAKWLSHVLPAGDPVIDRTARRLRIWLEHNREQRVLQPQ